MLRTDKERIVAELAERLRSAETLIVADYRGLTMKEIDALRGELLRHGARFTVVKNSLTRRAAEAAGADAVLALLQGPTAIAFLESDGDPVAVAKALNDAARTTRVLTVRGGILDGKPIGEEEVRSLATLPPAELLRAQVVGALAGPLNAVVGLFAAPLRDLVAVLDARIRQLEEQGETVEEAPSEPKSEAATAEPEAESGPEAGELEAEPAPEAAQESEADEGSETREQEGEES